MKTRFSPTSPRWYRSTLICSRTIHTSSYRSDESLPQQQAVVTLALTEAKRSATTEKGDRWCHTPDPLNLIREAGLRGRIPMGVDCKASIPKAGLYLLVPMFGPSWAKGQQLPVYMSFTSATIPRILQASSANLSDAKVSCASSIAFLASHALPRLYHILLIFFPCPRGPPERLQSHPQTHCPQGPPQKPQSPPQTHCPQGPPQRPLCHPQTHCSQGPPYP